uniref:Eukaryotic translation initiation factor 3 subunit C n=1 Tax=Scophthalmus maximus TaxID=52904 RepID=A0A8D3DC08_SCOMX
MSRFFATGSDSESEESSSADEITPKAPGTNFKQSLLLSDDEEDTKRVVRSAKDKRFEELTNLIKTIRNAMKIRDMAKCLEEFEQLCRAFLKSKNIVDKEGVPSFYIRLLADLEDYLNQLWEDKEGKKKMNKNNAKALSTLRQKIRKYNRDYETEVAAYKEVKTQESEKSSEKKVSKKKKPKKKERLEEEEGGEEGEEGEGGWEKVKGGAPLVKEKPKMFAKGTEINTVVVLKKLNEILQARGKKGTDRAAQIELLHALANISAENNLGIGILVKIKFNIIASLFLFYESLSISDQVFDLFLSFSLPMFFSGRLFWLVCRPSEHGISQSVKYVDNLKDEGHVCGIIDRLLDYLENKGSTEEICRIYLRRIMHTYYKFDYKAHRRSLGLQGESKSEQDQEESEGEDSAVIMDRLCKFIYAKDRTDRIRTCAILCHIYHHALHSRWYQARDLMLMSHLQDNIQHADPPVQILYNRTMVQLGICAFRQGMIKDAHNALLDIQSSGRAKELLGQGLLMRNMQERNAEQEKIEKRRQVPFHMHINLELLECVYLVSAMLLEIPYMAAHEFDARRRMISKQFHHQLRVGERQPLLGPPESMREHVVAASKAMKMGDWRTCHSFIINEKMNSKVWDLFPETQRVREMLVRKIQEESLRTYLFTYSSVYDSISMATLSEMFELEIPMVHSIISKMIINEELMASLDQPTQTVVMHRTEPTSLQNMALQLAEKLGSLVENNERVFDLKQGVYGGYFNRDQKGGYQNKQGYNRGGYNRNHNQSNY